MVKTTWATSLDVSTGRPIELEPAKGAALANPLRRRERPVGNFQWTVHNWWPMSFSPETGLVYISITDKRDVAPAEPAFRNGGNNESQPDKKDHKNDTTQQPEQKQERNYSSTENHLILASRAPLGPSEDDLPVVSVTMYRRFV